MIPDTLGDPAPCWYCQSPTILREARYYHQEISRTLKYSDALSKNYSVSYKEKTVTIPVCKECYSEYKNVEKADNKVSTYLPLAFGLSSLIPFLLVVFSCAAFSNNSCKDTNILLLLLPSLFISIPTTIWLYKNKIQKIKENALAEFEKLRGAKYRPLDTHPAFKEMTGWKEGKAPKILRT